MNPLMWLLSASVVWAGVKPTTPTGDLDQVYAPRRVALLVGVDEYDDSELQGLSYSAKDANDLARVLGDAEIGNYDEIVVLTDPARTTREGIAQAIEDVGATLQRDDTFFLYLSGHGTLTLDPVEGTELWFLPTDGDLSHPRESAIPVEWLEDAVNNAGAKRRVLVLDTCHNGRDKSGLSDTTRSRLASLRGDPPAPRSAAEVSESEARLYAAQYYQPAMEDPELGNGVYTHFLIKALTSGASTADLNGDGLVDVTEAHDYARDGTIRHTGGLQVPRAEYRIVGREEIYLAGNPSMRRRAEKAILTAYDGLLTSARLLVDGQARGHLPDLVAVDPGSHHIEVQTADGRSLGARTVRVRAGQTLLVEDLIAPDRDRFTVLAGGTASHGPAADASAIYTGELELGWQPWPTAKVVTPTFYTRASLGSGTLAYLDESPVLGGQVGLGAFAGFGLTDAIALGPELEVLGNWRSYTVNGQDQFQPMLTGAAGLRLSAEVPLGRATALAVRYDLRAIPVQRVVADTAQWQATFTHGLALGLQFR